jgi:hypothetical protein
MRKLLLSLAAGLFASAAQAQTYTADFEALSLSKSDTFYVNSTTPGTDMGFDDGMVHFPYYYAVDPAFGGYWNGGFAYSNMKDSVKGDFTIMYNAKPGTGALNSDKYAVYNPGYGKSVTLRTTARQKFFPQSVYLTNNTYAFNSMRDGDGLAKKFGGASGNDSDWLKLTIYAWSNGQRKSDSVNFYLADYRFANNALDYIVRDWRLVNLNSLGSVDSLTFNLTSTNNDQFGMLTPAYFCMDNLSITIPTTGVSATQPLARAYPNPAQNELNLDLIDGSVREARILDMGGRLVSSYPVSGTSLTIATAGLTPGTYVLQLESAGGRSAMRFVKQ